jgi:hypothetical protein
MACTCLNNDCTQVTIEGVVYCDCLVTQEPSCPEGSTLVNLGDGNMVCRKVATTIPTPCGTFSCDTANGYVYNPDTNKCEKKVLSEPCPPGYVFVNTDDGKGKCVPPGGTGTLICPTGYTYDGNSCKKITTVSATPSTVTSCKADIVLLTGINPNTLSREATFVNKFIDNITTGLNNNLTHDYRVGQLFCSATTSNSPTYLYSGTKTSPPPGTTITTASAYIKSLFPTAGSNQNNCIIKGLTNAVKTLYTSSTINMNGGTLPVRNNVRKIIVLITEMGPTSVCSGSFGSCVSNDQSNYMGHYPSNTGGYLELRKTINLAKCLISNYPNLEIFVVNTDSTPHLPSWFFGLEQQFFFDIKSSGSVYIVNNNTDAVNKANLIVSDIQALTAKTNAPAVCTTFTEYSCPIGDILVNGNQCQHLDIQEPLPCNSTCTITPSGDNAVCTCTLPEVPTNCGTCEVVNNKCSCTLEQNPIFISSVIPINLNDTKYFNKIEWTISYDPKSKMWISFHDWNPSLLIPSTSHFFTIKDNAFWKHNERFDSFTNYYNIDDNDSTKDYGWEVEYNIVTPNQITTLRSVEYYMEAYKYYNDGKDYFHVLDENFDRSIIYNSEQISPLLKLKIKDKNNPLQMLSYPIITSVNTEILASKEENKYRFNNFYDITKDRNEFSTTSVAVPGFNVPSSGISLPMFITNVNGYHKTINPAYIDVFKSPTEHKKFRHFGNKIILRKTKSGDKKMLLKLVNSKMLNSIR